MANSELPRELNGKRKAPAKKLGREDLRFLANLTRDELKAFNVLVAYGVDSIRLCKLIQKRKHPSGGRPPKTDEIARLIQSVDYYLKKQPDATLKDVICKVLEELSSYKRLSATQQSAKRRSVRQAYDREIEKRTARESESIDEYARRRRREMRERESAVNHKTPPKT